MAKADRIRWQRHVQELAFGGGEDALRNSVVGLVLGEGLKPHSLRDRGDQGLLVALAPLRDLDDATGAYDAWRPALVGRRGTAVLLVVPEAPRTFFWYLIGRNRLRPLNNDDVLHAIDPRYELRLRPEGGWDRSAVIAISKTLVATTATMAVQRWPSWARNLPTDQALPNNPDHEGAQP